MEGLGTLLLFALFFYLMMRFGCGAHMMHGHGSKKEKYIDPVCDMEVDADKGYGMVHQGESYRFCTRSCLAKFDADPDHFLNKKEGEHHEM
ncbi:MAG: YHS domain-containing protein [Gammaproteobacteria bacterium]|nr:YHS domain-containing protein [Gammaproteobacteria bacterium]